MPATRNAAPPYRGGCLCGAVRYEASAPTIGARICHCSACRVAMASPFLAQAQFQRRALTWQGTTARWRSSERLLRHFCPRCGTRLFLEPRDSPRIGIPLATLDDPGAILPEMHIWSSEAIPWALPEDGLPRYERGSPLPFRFPAAADARSRSVRHSNGEREGASPRVRRTASVPKPEKNQSTMAA